MSSIATEVSGAESAAKTAALQDLVQEGYLRDLPKDPFTNSRDTWQPAQEDYLQSVDQTDPGITDVHRFHPDQYRRNRIQHVLDDHRA